MKVIYQENYKQINYTNRVDDYYRLYVASEIRKALINEAFVEFMLDVGKPSNQSYEELGIDEEDIIEYLKENINSFIMENRGLPHNYFNEEILKLIGVAIVIEDDTVKVTMTF